MDITPLIQTAKELVSPKKGILAADESNKSADKRLAGIGADTSEEMRRQYRDLFLNTPGIEKYLSGVILYDETIHQKTNDGKLFHNHLTEIGVMPGIKVDTGTVPLPGFPDELITEGLDGLLPRVEEYASQGLKFAKWRSVIEISNTTPTETAIIANAHVLARYAGICHAGGLVPIVEPEVLLDGDHTMSQSEEITTKVLQHLFDQLTMMHVNLEAVILKSSMVLPGKDSDEEKTAEEIAEATVRTLKNTVPTEVPGVVFLSGGQSPAQATENLNEIAKLEPLPWEVAFSYARAIQGPALEIWKGEEANVESARKEYIKWLEMDIDADQGSL